MVNILFGLLFVFLKPNLSFLDIGVAYYITNIIGYISIYFGVKEIGRKYHRIMKVQPFVIFMVFHSIIFFLLNVSGNSPLTIEMSSYMALISLVGLGFIIVGMFMVFVIITYLIRGLEIGTGGIFNTRRLNILCSGMMTTFVVAGVCNFFIPLPEIAQILMSVLLVLKLLFLIEFYRVFLHKKTFTVGT
ncbi:MULTISPECIES: hypothetical protein [Bacillaceae]|uniref:Uncharacterized protein n=1 Tax=Evansella alkalicola TaxID=745819 RepID=A0ABS6JWS9_9BACI|nr:MULTISPECIES: hypothetical protein [Bacillaceae]MBU9723043.1 hypothetical protein [Bacillus alkalicola]